MYKKLIIGACCIFSLIACVYAVNRVQRIPMVDFDNSLQTERYPQVFTRVWGKPIYDICKKIYYKNGPHYVPYREELLIPRTIHQIWLGSPFPEKYRAFTESWLAQHPGWKYKLWTDKELATYPMTNRNLYDAAVNYGERSDIARYEILFREGGLYIDTDFECLRSLEQFHHYYDFYIGIQPLDTTNVQLGIGLIGSAPHHPLVCAAIEEMCKNAQKESKIIQKTGPVYFTKVFCTKAPALYNPIIVLPPTYFYPRGYKQAAEPREEWIKPESYAVHHWAGSWLKKDAFVKTVRLT